MSQKTKAVITATSSYLPDYTLTNKELCEMVETNEEWILTRTGIKERRILKDPNLGTSFMAIESSKKLLDKKGIDPKTIDLVLLTTATPDMPVAITSAYVASKIGATNAFCFDLHAACSGFIYALSVGRSYIESGMYKRILLIGADKMSSIVNYEDRTTCIIFGDASASVLLEPSQEGEEIGIIDEYLRSDGNGREFLKIPAGGSLLPTSQQTLDEGLHDLMQQGRYVFKNAVINMVDSIHHVLKKNQLNVSDIDWLTPHQANKRIIDTVGNELGIDSNKVMINIHKYGNTTTATIPLLLCEYEQQLRKGDKLILPSFGGGFTWGAVYLKWGYNSN